MTNGEIYKNEIKSLLKESFVAVIKGNPEKCVSFDDCSECELQVGTSCERALIDWMLQEHEGRRTLTKQERLICESAEDVYITRDRQGEYKDSVEWWVGRPTMHKDGTFHEGNGICLSQGFVKLKSRFGLEFNSIKPGECIPVKELLTWEVEE